MMKRRFFLKTIIFISATGTVLGSKQIYSKSKTDRKPVVFIVANHSKNSTIFKSWNQELGKPYDIVSDAPLVENLNELKHITVGSHAWMNPSVSDIQEKAPEVPENIEWVIYDFEHWKHTPKNEKNNIILASKTLRQFCDTKKWKTCFIPTYGDGLRMATKLAPYYDGYIVQCQKFQNDKKRNKTVVSIK